MKRICSLVFFCALSTFAQDPRGRILGRVTDPTGAVIPNVPVIAANIETGVVSSAQTNAQGNYLLLHLNPGLYKLMAELKGFKKFDRSEVEVRVGDALTIDI